MKKSFVVLFLILSLIGIGLFNFLAAEDSEEKWSCKNNITGESRSFIFHISGTSLEGVYEGDGKKHLKGTLSAEGKFQGEIFLYPWQDNSIYSLSEGKWFKAELSLNKEGDELSGVVHGKKWILTKEEQFQWSDKDYPINIVFSKQKEGEFFVGKSNDKEMLFHFLATDKWETVKNDQGFELTKGTGRVIIKLPADKISEKIAESFNSLIPGLGDSPPDISSQPEIEIDNIALNNLVISKEGGIPKLKSGQITSGGANIEIAGFNLAIKSVTFKAEEDAKFSGTIELYSSCGSIDIQDGLLKPGDGMIFSAHAKDFTKDYTSDGVSLSGFKIKNNQSTVFVDFSQTDDPSSVPSNWNGIGVFMNNADLVFPVSWKEINIPLKDTFIFSNGFRGTVKLDNKYETVIESDELGAFAAEVSPDESQINLTADKFYNSKLHLFIGLPPALNLGRETMVDLKAAEIDENGYFIAGISEIPELEIHQFKLEIKEAFFDFSKTKSPEGAPSNEFQGIYIPKLKLNLPLALQPKQRRLEALEAKEAFINKQGFSADVKLEGKLEAGLGGFDFLIQTLELSFRMNRLAKYQISGDVNIPYPKKSPVKLAVEVAIPEQGDIAAKIVTKETIKFAVFGMQMQIYESSSIEIKGLSAQVILDGKLISNDFIKEAEFKELKFGPEGISGLVHVAINENTEFGRGYSVYLDYLEFSDEYIGGKGAFSFANTFEVKNVELKGYFSGKIEVLNLAVKYDRAPVHFDGVLQYTETKFVGGIKLKVDNVFILATALVIGIEPAGSDSEFEYWYVALEAGGGTGIPLGSTGLSIFTLMGAVGYNYDPPTLTKGGSPSHGLGYVLQMGATFGNTPNGKVLRAKAMFTLTGRYFAVDGALILIDREKCKAEGNLTFYWDPEAVIAGSLATFVYLPDSGGLLKTTGRLEFRFSLKEFVIMSREINVDICSQIKGKGSFQITTQKIAFSGNLHYEDSGSYELFYQRIRGNAYFDANANLLIDYFPPQFRTSADFYGKVFVAFDYDVGVYEGTAVLLDSLVNTKADIGFGEGIGSDGILIDCIVNVQGSVLWFDIDYDFSFSYS